MNVSSSPGNSKSLTTLAFELIRADILEGRLQPNERLRIQALSERYEIGPTAIREALSRLTTNGTVGLEDQRGFFVAPISSEELWDLTRTRIALESLALGEAIKAGGLDWESGLLSAFHRLSKTPLPSKQGESEWNAAHQRFHEALIEGCGSPSLVRLCRLVLDQLERYRNLSSKHTTHELRGNSLGEHQALFDAAMARDTGQAQQLMAEHFSRTAEIVDNAVFGHSRTPSKSKGSRKAAKRTAAA